MTCAELQEDGTPRANSEALFEMLNVARADCASWRSWPVQPQNRVLVCTARTLKNKTLQVQNRMIR